MRKRYSMTLSQHCEMARLLNNVRDALDALEDYARTVQIPVRTKDAITKMILNTQNVWVQAEDMMFRDYPQLDNYPWLQLYPYRRKEQAETLKCREEDVDNEWARLASEVEKKAQPCG